MDFIWRMHPMKSTAARPMHVLLQFAASHELYSLSVTTHSFVKIASPRLQAGCFFAPLLSRELLVSQARQHRSDGQLYIFSEQHAAPSQPSIVILRDSDRDALVDDCRTMTLEKYGEAGYLSGSAWVE
jgi:hypothetical protein